MRIDKSSLVYVSGRRGMVGSAWGTGTPRREFLHVDDLAEAIVVLMERYDEEAIVNVGCGEDITIRALCERVMSVAGYAGRLEFDTTKPDGTPRQLLDNSKINALGWYPKDLARTGNPPEATPGFATTPTFPQ